MKRLLAICVIIISGLLVQPVFAQMREAKIVHFPDKIVYLIPSDLLFEMNDAILIPESLILLDVAADLIKKYPDHQISITTSSDAIENNIRFKDRDLSVARMAEVVGYLWTQGVHFAQNITYAGVGDREPIASNQNLAGLTTNRNVRLTITPPNKQMNSSVVFIDKHPRYYK